MATQKPISTISYNSEPFLKDKLDELVEAHIIQAYMYIKHKGEGGDKDHIHLRIEPNKKLDPMDLTELFKEYELGKDKPRKCRPWRFSKEEDWFLYAVHDSDYMKLKYPNDKNEKLPYSWEEIIVSEDYDLDTAFIRAKQSLEHGSANLVKRVKNGESVSSMIERGENPYLVNQVLRALSGTDYERLSSENVALRSMLDSLMKTLADSGIVVSFDNDNKASIEFEAFEL